MTFKCSVLLGLLALPGVAQEKPAAPLIPCFSEKGPIAFRVEGVDVPKATVDRFVGIWKIRMPSMSDKTRLRNAIEKGIVPIAALYARYRSEVPEMSKRAWKAYRRLKKGEKWDVVAKEESDDPNRFGTAGSVGIRRRLYTPGLAPPGDLVEDVGFAVPLDGFSQPFATQLGIQIVSARSEEKKADPAETTREILRVLGAWDAEYRAFLQKYPHDGTEAEREAAGAQLQSYKARYRRVIAAARVELLERSYESAFYPFRLKKKR